MQSRWSLLAALLVMLTLASGYSHAGLLSGLAKLGKKADGAEAPSVGIKTIDVDLPGYDGAMAIRPVQDASGNWNVQLADQGWISLRDLDSLRRQVGSDKLVVVFDHWSLPDQLHSLDKLPAELPIIMQQKGKSYGLVAEAGQWRLQDRHTQLPVSSAADVKRASWHLQRPWSSHPLHLVSSQANHWQERLGGSIHSTPLTALLEAPSRFKFQTLVLPGKISGAEFQLANSNQRLSMPVLQQLAQRYDINVVLLGADDAFDIRQIADNLAKQFPDPLTHGSTGDLFNRFASSGQPITLQIHRSGNSHLLLDGHLQDSPKQRQLQTDHMIPALVDGLSTSATSQPHDDTTSSSSSRLIEQIQIMRPDQDRAEELDDRWHPWVHSYIQWYLILSTLMGLVCFQFCRSVWHKAWAPRARETFEQRFAYWAYSSGRGALFVLLFIPLTGAMCFVVNALWIGLKIASFVVTFTIWLPVNYLLIKPLRFVYHRLHR